MAKHLPDESIVAALISEGTIQGAAAAVGCTPRTLYERMKQPSFKELYNAAKADMVRAATTKLQTNMAAAVDSIVQIMTDAQTGPGTRLNAAVALLQYGHRFTEQTDILERLEALEQAAAEADTARES